MILIGAAALVLVVTTWLGWRAGVVRQLVSLGALVASVAVIVFGGRFVMPLLASMGIAERWAFAGSMVLGLLLYGFLTLLSWLLLKRTSHQEVGAVRVTYGFFGAVIGLLKGLLVIWVAAVGIRFAGEITALQSELAQRAQAPAPTQQAAIPPGASGLVLAEMSRVLDHGIVGAALDRVDPLPAPIRQNGPRLMRVLADDNAMSRFRSYPGVRDLVNHPKIIDLGTDRDFQRAAAAGDLISLAQQPRMQAVLGDEEVLAILGRIELGKALDHALATKPKRASVPDVPSSRRKRFAP